MHETAINGGFHINDYLGNALYLNCIAL
uniref:Uncharacterized protein n=1 Tax=Anguilla anguilla TaxID=7936 RepID=A0A0E9VXP9_ANGAN